MPSRKLMHLELTSFALTLYDLKAYSKAQMPFMWRWGLFVHRYLYSIKKIGEMQDKCPRFSEDFFIEPGFYLVLLMQAKS